MATTRSMRGRYTLTALYICFLRDTVVRWSDKQYSGYDNGSNSGSDTTSFCFHVSLRPPLLCL